MEETMVMNELQPVESENKKADKNNTWKQVVVGGVSGIALGGIATATIAATTNYPTEGEEAEGTTLSGVNGSAHVDSSIPVAEVSDDMSFGEAFASAHDQVGPGGVFVWHGQVYGTYTADEWNSMTPAEHAEFGSHVNVVYDEPTHSTQTTAGTVSHESGATAATESGNVSSMSEQQEVHADNHDSEEASVQPPATTQEEPIAEVEVPVVEVSHEPQVEVLDYETITNEDGSQMDLAVISVDGQEMGLYDVDQDGIADLLAQDTNNDNQITPNEIEDISTEDISMQPFHDEYIAQNDPAMHDPDYINDGDVESYMA